MPITGSLLPGVSFSLTQIHKALVNHETKITDSRLQLIFNTTYRNWFSKRKQTSLNSRTFPVLHSTFMTVSSPKFLNRNSQLRKLSQSKINSTSASSTLQ